jgi:hypothetical protein
MPGPPKKFPTCADLGFSEELTEQMEDLCEGYGGSPQHRIIEIALGHFFNNNGIDFEAEVKKRYLVARAKRAAAKQGRS